MGKVSAMCQGSTVREWLIGTNKGIVKGRFRHGYKELVDQEVHLEGQMVCTMAIFGANKVVIDRGFNQEIILYEYKRKQVL